MPLLSFHLDEPNVLAVEFEHNIISVILFTALFDNLIIICFMSAGHVPLVLSCLCNPSTLALFNRSLFWLFVSCLNCELDTDLFHVSSTCVTGWISFPLMMC